MKILIVDDNKQITSILKEYSIKEGFEPIIAFDGDDAINKFGYVSYLRDRYDIKTTTP